MGTMTAPPHLAAAAPGGSAVAAMDLHEHDVVRIGPHTVHGIAVDCREASIEVTGIRWGDDAHSEVVIDYQAAMEFPGPGFRSAPRGCVVYDRLAALALLWHETGGAA